LDSSFMRMAITIKNGKVAVSKIIANTISNIRLKNK